MDRDRCIDELRTTDRSVLDQLPASDDRWQKTRPDRFHEKRSLASGKKYQLLRLGPRHRLFTHGGARHALEWVKAARPQRLFQSARQSRDRGDERCPNRQSVEPIRQIHGIRCADDHHDEEWDVQKPEVDVQGFEKWKR